MPRSLESPGARLQTLWTRLSPLPGGRRLFSILLGRMVPYTASIGGVVEQLDPGHVRVTLRDRRAVRNHLHSVHAIALTNLGELSTGLAVMGALPPTVRGILVGIETEYLKKARGTLEAEARCQVPEVTEAEDYVVEALIRDQEGDTVAVVRARWRLAPVPAASAPA
jgi:acyl-coenzyme A thioesterase PaaI-like protein